MPARPLVAVTDHLQEAKLEEAVLGMEIQLLLLQTSDEGKVLERVPGVHALLCFHDIRLTERSFKQLSHCMGIVRCGVGYDNIDIEAAGRHGIVVCNVPDYGTEEVADHALLLLLALARRLVPCFEAVRAGSWHPESAYGTPRLRGQTLGIIGCGRIGSAMALRGKALGMRVLIHDPYQPDGLEKSLGVERCVSLHELLPQAQFVSLHCPLTPETRHLLDHQAFERLPRGAYVINTARGPCLDGQALLAGLESGQVAYAALDVVEGEPLLDDRIRRHPRILLTPHSAFYSIESFAEMRTKGAQEARRLIRGEAVRNPVNLHLLHAPRCVLRPDALARLPAPRKSMP